MPIRNPFSRRPADVQDENVRPGLSPRDPSHPGFERVDTVGSKASSALSIRSFKNEDNGDYKMSVVNDSGVYLPPSPIEEKGLWPRINASRASMDTRSSLGDIEHFSISRESFDSYRRSFDISAKSPVLGHEPSRQSLDSARFSRLPPRSSIRDRNWDKEPPTAEEGFEDVGLQDEQKQLQQLQAQQQQQQTPQQQAQPKKRGFLARFSDNPESNAHATHAQGGMSRFIPGRKRAQSGQGAELGSMDRPMSAQPREEDEDEGQEMQ